MVQDDSLPFHRYPKHDSIPHGMVLLWRPSTGIHHFSCQYPGCGRRVKGHKGAMKHGRTAHKDHQPKCHTGDRPLSEEGRANRKKEAARRRQAVHRKKVRNETLCRHASLFAMTTCLTHRRASLLLIHVSSSFIIVFLPSACRMTH